jgi:hypothetical protein
MFGSRGKKKTKQYEEKKSAVLKEALVFWVVAQNKTILLKCCYVLDVELKLKRNSNDA